MNDLGAMVMMAIGAVILIFGFTGKQFYLSKGLYGAIPSDRKLAKWKGRILFVAGGVVLILVGIKSLLIDRR